MPKETKQTTDGESVESTKQTIVVPGWIAVAFVCSLIGFGYILGKITAR